MIEETYVSFETAKLLKEKGFDEATYNFYHISDKFMRNQSREVGNLQKYNETELFISAPTQQMAMKWLREVHNLHVDVDPSEGNWWPTILELENWSSVVEDETGLSIYDSYEEAVEAALKYCLENILEA